MLSKHRRVMLWLSPVREEMTEVIGMAPSGGCPREVAAYSSPAIRVSGVQHDHRRHS